MIKVYCTPFDQKSLLEELKSSFTVILDANGSRGRDRHWSRSLLLRIQYLGLTNSTELCRDQSLRHGSLPYLSRCWRHVPARSFLPLVFFRWSQVATGCLSHRPCAPAPRCPGCPLLCPRRRTRAYPASPRNGRTGYAPPCRTGPLLMRFREKFPPWPTRVLS